MPESGDDLGRGSLAAIGRDQLQDDKAVVAQIALHERSRPALVAGAHLVRADTGECSLALMNGRYSDVQVAATEAHTLGRPHGPPRPHEQAERCRHRHPHQPHPNEHEHLLVEDVDRQRTLDRVVVHVVAEKAHLKVTHGDARKAWRCVHHRCCCCCCCCCIFLLMRRWRMRGRWRRWLSRVMRLRLRWRWRLTRQREAVESVVEDEEGGERVHAELVVAELAEEHELVERHQLHARVQHEQQLAEQVETEQVVAAPAATQETIGPAASAARRVVVGVAGAELALALESIGHVLDEMVHELGALLARNNHTANATAAADDHVRRGGADGRRVLDNRGDVEAGHRVERVPHERRRVEGQRLSEQYEWHPLVVADVLHRCVDCLFAEYGCGCCCCC